MSIEKNVAIAQALLAQLGSGAAPETISEAFAADMIFEIAGDAAAFPWIGKRVGRVSIEDFLRATRSLIKQTRFDVEDIAASDNRAVIVGDLSTDVLATGKTIDSAFAIILTISADKITRFQMLEDSFDVSRAARP
jgi:ketosteroid isomerase-like protein